MLIRIQSCIVGWGNTPSEPSFGGAGNDAASVKGKMVDFIGSVRTLMRSEFFVCVFSSWGGVDWGGKEGGGMREVLEGE